MMIDKHTLAVVSIVGSSLDLLGALYLAYDLLGGERGIIIQQRLNRSGAPSLEV
jgi:hypothetical protein